MKYTCDVTKLCNKSFSTFEALELHKAAKHKTFTCAVCNAGFPGSEDIEEHYQSDEHKSMALVRRYAPPSTSVSNIC